jgi:hypothetical protein
VLFDARNPADVRIGVIFDGLTDSQSCPQCLRSRRLGVDWVLWDNRSVMHQANPDYDMRERRRLYRLLLKGEVPV